MSTYKATIYDCKPNWERGELGDYAAPAKLEVTHHAGAHVAASIAAWKWAAQQMHEDGTIGVCFWEIWIVHLGTKELTKWRLEVTLDIEMTEPLRIDG